MRWRRHSWSDPDASGIWEPGEEGTLDGRSGGLAVESLDPALELPLATEAAGWIEREMFATVGIRTGIVWRGERNHFLRHIGNRPCDAFTRPVVISDPGPDGRLGKGDDGAAIQGYDLTSEHMTDFAEMAESFNAYLRGTADWRLYKRHLDVTRMAKHAALQLWTYKPVDLS